MPEPWSVGLLLAALQGGLGLATWASRAAGVRAAHRLGLFALVAWSIVGAATVLWTRDATAFDQGMGIGLLALCGLTGYLSPKRADPGWTRAVHALLGAVVIAWYGVLAHRFGGLLSPDVLDLMP